MAKEIELSSLDLRYEGHRMKNPGLEERLLVSIAQRGIEEPLEGVQREQASILLNGFKRYRVRALVEAIRFGSMMRTAEPAWVGGDSSCTTQMRARDGE